MAEDNVNVKVAFMEEQIKELKEQNKDFEKRLTSIETSREKTEYQYEQIMDAIKKLNEVTLPNILAELESIKNRPAKRWDNVINAAIAGIVAIIVSLLFKGAV